MADMSFDFDASELIQALEVVEKQFPASAEKVLKNESRKIAKDLKTRVNSEAKGHHYKGNGTAPKPLESSFRQGKVIHSGSKITTAVTSTAPHYHLYEQGHDMVTHNIKDKKGRGRAGTGKKVGEVKGRKTVARYMAQRSEYAALIGQELLNEVLKEAGFDS